MITKYSRYFQRTFAQFMDVIHHAKDRKVAKPQLKDSDIESFFIHVAELKARVEELETEIAKAYFRTSGTHDQECLDRLAKDCRLPQTELHERYDKYMRTLEHDRRYRQMYMTNEN